MRGACRPRVSIRLDGRRPGRVHVSQVVRRRRVRSDARTGVRTGSSWNLPEGSLCLVAHPSDSFRVLADEPGPERERYFGEGSVGNIFVGKGVLAHSGPHVTGIHAYDGDVARLEFRCKCFRGKVEGGLA